MKKERKDNRGFNGYYGSAGYGSNGYRGSNGGNDYTGTDRGSNDAGNGYDNTTIVLISKAMYITGLS